jgi:hypothetical protein
MTYRTFAAIVLTFVLAQAVTAAQNAPPAMFVYKMTMSAGSGSGSMDYSLDVAVKSTNPDGSRASSLTIHAPKMPPIDKKTVDATLTPSGAITIGSTGDMPKGNINPYNSAQMKQMQAASIAPMLQSMIAPLNAFASGLAAAPSFKNGATWQAHSDEAMADVTYTVTGHEQRNGRDTAVITMKSSSSGPSVSGHGNYDPVAHVVVAVHCEIRQTAGAAQGQILDASLSGP